MNLKKDQNFIYFYSFNDDIILLSPTEGHMKILLKNCESYEDQWKIEFNSNKSFSMSINCSSKTEFFLNKLVIPIANSLIYLGLPLGEEKFTFEYF